MYFRQMRSVMRIGVNHNFYTMLFRHPQMNVIQVEAIRISIQFHRHFVLCRLAENRIHIELVAVTT